MRLIDADKLKEAMITVIKGLAIVGADDWLEVYGKIVNAINDAPTVLPKGHGRLIDEMEVLEMTKSYKSELGRLKADPFVKCGIETVEGFIQNVPTIIEADKEAKNE